MGTSGSTTFQEAHLTLVLSSGRPLHTQQVPTPCPAAFLKQQLRSALCTQLSAYLQASPPPSQLPPAALLRSSPGEHLEHTKLSIETMPLRLYEYRGNELNDTQDVTTVQAPICVLGGSDVATTCCDIHGNVGIAVFNLETEVVWQEVESLSSRDGDAIELVVYSTSSDVFLCSGRITETVHSFKKRLSKSMKIPDNMTLWYQNVLLEAEKSLKVCGLHHRSRIFLLFPGDELGLARDFTGQYALLPLRHCEKTPSVCRAARILRTEWSLLETATEYMCLFPSSTYPAARHFLIGHAEDRFVTIEEMQGRSRVVIPAEGTVKEVKACIEAQHGLPASILSLTAIVELVESHAISISGLIPGDSLSISRKLAVEIPIRVKVILPNMQKMRFLFLPSTPISLLKLSLMSRNAAIDRDMVFLRGTEIIDTDNRTLVECGIFEYAVLHCGSLSEMLEIAKRRKVIVPSMSKTPPPSAESPFELFDSGQILDRKSHSERFQGYLKAVDSALFIRFIAPKNVLSLYVLQTATVKELKSALAFKVKRPPFSLIWQDKALNDDKTLIEQGVETGNTVLIKPIGAIRVNLALAAGTLVPVELDQHGNGTELGHLIGQLTGLQANFRRIVYTKPLVNDNLALSNAFSTLHVGLKLGKGRKHRLQTDSGAAICVEADLSATPAAIEAELKRHGVDGVISS